MARVKMGFVGAAQLEFKEFLTMPFGGYVLLGVLSLLPALLAVLDFAKRRIVSQFGLQLLCVGAYFAAVIHFFGLP